MAGSGQTTASAILNRWSLHAMIFFFLYLNLWRCAPFLHRHYHLCWIFSRLPQSLGLMHDARAWIMLCVCAWDSVYSITLIHWTQSIFNRVFDGIVYNVVGWQSHTKHQNTFILYQALSDHTHDTNVQMYLFPQNLIDLNIWARQARSPKLGILIGNLYMYWM